MPSRSRGFFSSEDGLCLGFFICVSRKVDGGFFFVVVCGLVGFWRVSCSIGSCEWMFGGVE